MAAGEILKAKIMRNNKCSKKFRDKKIQREQEEMSQVEQLEKRNYELRMNYQKRKESIKEIKIWIRAMAAAGS